MSLASNCCNALAERVISTLLERGRNEAPRDRTLSKPNCFRWWMVKANAWIAKSGMAKIPLKRINVEEKGRRSYIRHFIDQKTWFNKQSRHRTGYLMRTEKIPIFVLFILLQKYKEQTHTSIAEQLLACVFSSVASIW